MKPNELLDNLSTHLKEAIARAISLATSMGHQKVMLLHIFAGLIEEKGSVASEILKKFTIDRSIILDRLARLPASKQTSIDGTLTTLIPELDRVSKKALERAMLLAYEREHNYIGTEHLLYGMLQSTSKDIGELCSDLAIEKQDIIDHIEHMLESTSRFPDIEDVSDVLDGIEDMMEQTQAQDEYDDEEENEDTVEEKKPTQKKKKEKPKALALFAVELTDAIRQQEIDPVIGRADEIERLIHILCRRTKNNPVLVGEPGVGKTAIVEGLAKKISEGDVPDVLKRKKIFSLDLTMLISGTIYRGEFEARLKSLIEECSKHDDYILFIDELHNIIGAGSNQGTMDAANMLKPALARGKLHCIGATTFDEYKKYITGDPALDRRFQSIEVQEPSEEEAITIMHGIKPFYDDHHGTNIQKDAIETAVKLSTKYIHDYFLPDKAIDLLDEAAASVRVKQKQSAISKKIDTALQKREELFAKKEAAIHSEAFDEAMSIKQEIADHETVITDLKEKEREAKKKKRKRVTAKDVAQVLGKRMHVDPELLLSNDWERLETLEDRLKSHIVGQDHVLSAVVRALRQSYLRGAKNPRPLATFLFTGPSGVGKTKLAQALAKELYFDDRALLRIDMTEFAEAHGVSKLLGSPAGYVGYKERNRFIDGIKSRPYSVVLFDEFDKAHPDVRKLLYQMLDEGTLTDSAGKKVSFKHATIVLTGNTGADLFRRGQFGFGNQGTQTGIYDDHVKSIHHSLKQEFGSSFIGRIQETCVLYPLSKEAIATIIERYIDEISTDLHESQKISIQADKTALTQLAEASLDSDVGIRNMHHVVDQVIHSLLVEQLQKKETKSAYTLTHKQNTFSLT